MKAPRPAALLSWFAALVLLGGFGQAGCGEDDLAPSTQPSVADVAPARLTIAERRLIRESERAIQAYCRRVKIAATGTGRAPSVRQQAGALEAVDELVALAASKPDAVVSEGVDTGLFLGDLAENLQGSNCDPAIVTRLDAGLATVP